MLFQETINEPHISQILCGDKTETRRTSKRWEEKLKDLTKESACHEGLYTIKEFYKIWEVINKKLDLDEKLKHINLYL